MLCILRDRDPLTEGALRVVHVHVLHTFDMRHFVSAINYTHLFCNHQPHHDRGVTQPSGAPVTSLGQGPSPLI